MNNLNLIYMAKPSYGGWISFTAHLSRKYNLPLYKIGKRTETLKDGSPRLRKYGYNVNYQNISIEDAIKLPNILITAIDKKYYTYLDEFPDETFIVIHDPTEVKGKSTQQVIDNLPRFRVLTIRKTVQKYLMEKFNIYSHYLPHPFYPYKKSNVRSKTNAVAISRIDFDKHTDKILLANKYLPSNKQVTIYGKKNDLYVYHHLKNKMKLNINKHYGGTFSKSFEELDKILKNSKYVVDLSAIKNDGGGSQYTFLEAIYQGSALILNKKWIDNLNSPFKHRYNCLVIEDEYDLVDILNNNINTTQIIKNAKKLLNPHIEVQWDSII